MHLYFSTVIRNAPPDRGGELVCLDWDAKRVEATVPIAARNPTLDDPNPRGNTRGGRGVAVVGDEVVVASYHTLRVFDRGLAPQRDLTHPLMAGLHEVTPTGRGSVWVTATAIDAALEIDLESGKALREFWPREQPGLQRELGLAPLDVDKSADNRARFAAGDHLGDASHLHLNAVAEHDGDVLALFNRLGAVASLSEDRVVVRDGAIRKGHNLLVDGNRLWVNDTPGRRLFAFDLSSGGRERKISLMKLDAVSERARPLDRRYRIARFLHERGLRRVAPPLPIFLRGLARAGDRLFVGISPAAILCLDAASGRLRDTFQYSNDVHTCIHGLTVVR
ncbi:MAG: hypothetical protein O7G30_09200 [Proteobacteria bacterium]|nr:hypothetical protein [Pseudomonadota bacterium]